MNWRALPLPPTVAGRIWLAAMPGRLEPWPAFEARARAAGLGRIVCLTPLQEVAQLSPAYRTALSQGGLPWHWQALPMPDLGVAEDAAAFRAGVLELAEALGRGEVALLHCAAGIGRTGTTAACLLKHLGLTTEQALAEVRRSGSNPESARQSGLIDEF